MDIELKTKWLGRKRKFWAYTLKNETLARIGLAPIKDSVEFIGEIIAVENSPVANELCIHLSHTRTDIKLHIAFFYVKTFYIKEFESEFLPKEKLDLNDFTLTRKCNFLGIDSYVSTINVDKEGNVKSASISSLVDDSDVAIITNNYIHSSSHEVYFIDDRMDSNYANSNLRLLHKQGDFKFL